MDTTSWAVVGGVLAGAGALAYGRAHAALREARAALDRARKQRVEGESLFAAVTAASPTALVVLRGAGTIVFTNPAARELFFEGKEATGTNLLERIGTAPAPFREALLGDDDVLFTVGDEGDDETYHLSKIAIASDGDPLTAIVVSQMTRELRKQEIAVWKKVLRVISHELNNSLAPISSMAHSARVLAKNPEKLHRLDEVFDTIEERTKHLQTFLAGYAELARLPAPRRAHVAWAPVLARLREAWPRVSPGGVPDGTGWFDEGQVEQLLVNLVKNASEARPEGAIAVDVRRVDGGFELAVSDRGPGMSEEVLRNALLPFYSTKERGTGLGLALCREIVEAHGGKIRLKNREGGGLEVTCFFPHANAKRATDARLTVTRT
jgi:two-component system nitrogen regulation sensor histidine kinase NtrY